MYAEHPGTQISLADFDGDGQEEIVFPGAKEETQLVNKMENNGS